MVAAYSWMSRENSLGSEFPRANISMSRTAPMAWVSLQLTRVSSARAISTLPPPSSTQHPGILAQRHAPFHRGVDEP